MSERKQHGGKIALANKILIPGIAARKFPAVDVIYSDGRKSKLAIVFDASGVDASKLAVPEASLVCLSFRANSQRHISGSMAMEGLALNCSHENNKNMRNKDAMVDSWSKPFYDAFSESKSVQLYEVLCFCYLTFHSFLACVVNQLLSVFCC
ncbi:Phosphopantetheine adenylyltransferase [Gossypium arboreum]|uniref:Phosphopantetheine adenylyltransferase n=1 Tax=Gossypium arboreum TaxID=29729 RepID=A0A0B0PLY1_GOSAR|nr:Phosphopantetheine adenylyltransferase [Gossypium arboreum]